MSVLKWGYNKLVKLSENGFVKNDLFIDEKLYNEIKDTYGVPKINDILISGVGTIGIPWIVVNENKFYFKDGNVIWLKSKDKIFSKYIFYLFKSEFIKNYLKELASGTTVDTYTIVNAKKTKIPLPPLETQQLIVNRIESLFSKLDEAAEKVQAVIDSHEARKQAILHKAFSGELTRDVETKEDDLYKDIPEIPKEEQPYPLPEGWKWVKIGDILNLQAGKNITSKYISSTMTTDYLYPCYGGNGIRGYVREFNRNGKYYIIGRQGALCGNINLAIGKFYATEHAVVVNKKIHNLDIDYAGMYLKYMNLNQYASATAQPGLAVRNIEKLPFLLPPLKIQQRIVNCIESLVSKLDEAAEPCQLTIDKIIQLKKSILHKAFCGNL